MNYVYLRFLLRHLTSWLMSMTIVNLTWWYI